MVGSHHAARELARRGWRVLLLVDPASTAHMLAAPLNQSALARLNNARVGASTLQEGLQALTPMTMMPLAGRFGANFSFALRHWMALTFPSLQTFLRQAGFSSPDLMMLDGALYAPLVRHLRPRRSVLRLFDWPDGAVRHPAALRAAEVELAKTVDAVAISAPGLGTVARNWGARAVVEFFNGVDIEHFSTPHAEPEIYGPIRQPRIVYMGAIAPWIDVRMMQSVATRMPDCQFIWIGSGVKAPSLRGPNIHMIGATPYAALPALLQHAQVGIIPFDTIEHRALVDCVNPLKLYEYAAAGLPVVATATRALQAVGSPALLAEGTEAFVDGIRHALADSKAPNAMRAFAQHHDWSRRVDGLLASIGLKEWPNLAE